MIVIGGGPAGILAAISASKKRRKGYNSWKNEFTRQKTMYNR